MSAPLCPCCAIAPCRPVGALFATTCGALLCRQAWRRQTDRHRKRRARGDVRAATIVCQACGTSFDWAAPMGRRPTHCDGSACRKRRMYDRDIARRVKERTERPPRATIGPETIAQVDLAITRATEARRARERAAGQREFTVTDGWLQRGSRYGGLYAMEGD